MLIRTDLCLLIQILKLGERVGVRARDNPFSSERVHTLLPFEPEWLGETWLGLMERLEEIDYRGAVVGPHGSGKSNLLLSLKSRLQAKGFSVQQFFLNEESRDLNEGDWARLEAAGQSVVFLDGAEQFSWLKWRRFLRMASRCRGVVITQHRAGKLPLLLNTQTDAGMFRDFVRRLDPEFEKNETALNNLYESCQGNVREALWFCYDIAAR